jgi:hypothetical protein
MFPVAPIIIIIIIIGQVFSSKFHFPRLIFCIVYTLFFRFVMYGYGYFLFCIRCLYYSPFVNGTV